MVEGETAPYVLTSLPAFAYAIVSAFAYAIVSVLINMQLSPPTVCICYSVLVAQVL